MLLIYRFLKISHKLFVVMGFMRIFESYLQFYTNIAVFRGKSGWILAEKIFEIKRKEVWISLSNLQRDLC